VKEDPGKRTLYITKTELSIVHALREGKTTKEIAKERDRSIKTVEVHRNAMLRRLRCHNTAQLINMLWEHQILPNHGNPVT